MFEKIRNRRKNFFINPRFQFHFIAQSVGMAFFVIFVTFIANKVFFWEFYTKGKSLGLPDNHVFFRFIADQEFKLMIIYGVVSLVSFVALITYGMLMSHRIAGPIYRLDQDMQAIAEGKKKKQVTFRKGDFFPELATSFNAQLSYWHSKVGLKIDDFEDAKVNDKSSAA